MAPKKERGNNFINDFTSRCPERKNMKLLVKEPIELANLFVASAAVGEMPVNKRAGNVMSPPPPTTESTNAAKNPKTIKMSKMVRFKSSNNMFRLAFCFHYNEFSHNKMIKVRKLNESLSVRT